MGTRSFKNTCNKELERVRTGPEFVGDAITTAREANLLAAIARETARRFLAVRDEALAQAFDDFGAAKTDLAELVGISRERVTQVLEEQGKV